MYLLYFPSRMFPKITYEIVLAEIEGNLKNIAHIFFMIHYVSWIFLYYFLKVKRCLSLEINPVW